jgi:hypothetical protein
MSVIFKVHKSLLFNNCSQVGLMFFIADIISRINLITFLYLLPNKEFLIVVVEDLKKTILKNGKIKDHKIMKNITTHELISTSNNSCDT